MSLGSFLPANFGLRLQKIRFGLGTSLGRKALRLGVGASVEHRAAFAGRNFKTIVDAGANRGQFSLFARTWFPAAQIVAFEPLAAPAAVFTILFAGDAGTRLEPLALGSQIAETTINVTEEDDSSSILPIGRLQSATFGTRWIRSETITVQRLDRLLTSDQIKSPALLKIDTQGYESEVLAGCGALLACFDCLYVELSYRELYEGQVLAGGVITKLDEMGFRLGGVFNQAVDASGTPVQADFLFTRVG